MCACPDTPYRVSQMKKKLRECEALAEKRAKSEALTGPEEEKLGRMPAWWVGVYVGEGCTSVIMG